MPVAMRSDEHGSRLRPFPGARPLRRGQWTAGVRRLPTAFVTAVKVSNGRMRGSQFSSYEISLLFWFGPYSISRESKNLYSHALSSRALFLVSIHSVLSQLGNMHST